MRFLWSHIHTAVKPPARNTEIIIMKRIVLALALLGVVSPGLASPAEMTLDCPSAHCQHKEPVEPNSTIVYIGKCSGAAGKMECDAEKKSSNTKCTEKGQDTCTCTNGSGIGYVDIGIAC